MLVDFESTMPRIAYKDFFFTIKEDIFILRAQVCRIVIVVYSARNVTWRYAHIITLRL
jgi:hypothetical protein